MENKKADWWAFLACSIAGAQPGDSVRQSQALGVSAGNGWPALSSGALVNRVLGALHGPC